MEIKELIENCIKKHIASGYRYNIEMTAPQEVIDEMKKEYHFKVPVGYTEDDIVHSIGGFCGYKESSHLQKYAKDEIYIFVEGIKKSVEKFKEIASAFTVEQMIKFCVIHECRHSQQILAIREAHMNPDDIFRIESEKYPYGQGPMETDANQYAMEYMIDPNMKQRPYEGKALDIMWKKNKEEFDKLLVAV